MTADTPTPERDAERLIEANADLAHEIMCEAHDACGVYHTTAAGKIRRQLDARDAALRERDAEIHDLVETVRQEKAEIERLKAIIHGMSTFEWRGNPKPATPAQPGAEHVQRARELIQSWVDADIPIYAGSSLVIHRDIAAALAVAEQRGYAQAREDAAQAARGNGDHKDCGHGEGYMDGRLDAEAAIRALSPAEGEPR